MSGGPIRTLHVDIEGGWGGSSRSLFELLNRLDRSRILPLVAHRQKGPLQQWYRELSIDTEYIPEIGSFVPRQRKAAKNLLMSLPRLRRLEAAADKITMIATTRDIDLLHLNYEGLFLLGQKLRRRLPSLPIVGHSRAHLPLNLWGRWLAQGLSKSVDWMFYISPQEELRFRELAGNRVPRGHLMWNIARHAPARMPFADPPEVVYFGTLDWTKGTDRLIDVAAALDAISAPPLRVAIYGNARTSPGFARSLAERIERDGLDHRVSLRGYSTQPMTIMSSAFALIRPSRDADPWGRDLIEAAACGLPAVATGSFEGVVQNGRTGFLLPTFDASRVARLLVELMNEERRWSEMSRAAMAWAAERFGGGEQVNTFTDTVEALVWRSRKGGAARAD